jgi:hypothetical protein
MSGRRSTDGDDKPTLNGESASVSSLLPSFAFTAEDMGADENISAWRDAVATLFDVDELASNEADRFRADFRSYAMGPVLLGLARASGQRFRRTPETIARSGVDHIILQFYAKGSYDGQAGDLPLRVRAGDTRAGRSLPHHRPGVLLKLNIYGYWEDEFKRPRSLGEGTGAKASDNSEAPQRSTASRLVSTIPRV